MEDNDFLDPTLRRLMQEANEYLDERENRTPAEIRGYLATIPADYRGTLRLWFQVNGHPGFLPIMAREAEILREQAAGAA